MSAYEVAPDLELDPALVSGTVSSPDITLAALLLLELEIKAVSFMETTSEEILPCSASEILYHRIRINFVI
jgi:hypothetical protein